MKINERSLIEGLSYALDVAEKTYFSHSKHVAYLSAMISKELNLTKDEQKNIYIASLLHDIGAGNINYDEDHCEMGKEIISHLPLDSAIAEYIYYHHEYFDGSGNNGIVGENIPIGGQIICLTNSFDIMFRELKEVTIDEYAKINEWIDKNKNLYAPELVDAFKTLIEKEYILLDYYNREFNNILAKKINIEFIELDYEGVKAYAHAFSKIIDRRSNFTYRHSIGIAELTNKITIGLGYDTETQNKMYIAALLHDIGKLVISNDIIDKEGKLDTSERYEINKHTYYTRWILEQIDGFEEITEYASNHHEKLNGKGYPLKLRENEISELDRIMAICDILQALTEERPYRDNMPIEKVWSIIDSMVENYELDADLVSKVKVVLKDEFK